MLRLLLLLACSQIHVLSYLSIYKRLNFVANHVPAKPYLKLSSSNDKSEEERFQFIIMPYHTIHENTLKLDVLCYDRTSKGTQENEVRANLRANIEVVANRSRYTSTDYFPDDNEFSPDILTSLKSTRSYFSILVGIYSKLVVEACIIAAIYHNPSEQ